MTIGDYYLSKSNGTSFDEKIFTAVSGKVLGFDSNQNPIMLDISSDADIVSESFSHTSSVTITHPFINFPIVQVLDGNNSQIIPLSVNHLITGGSVTITFSASTSGTIQLMGMLAANTGEFGKFSEETILALSISL